MSQSPDDTRQEGVDKYAEGWAGLARELAAGRSFSGRERHCAFLNTGESSFANVSGVTGLDFIDDGRAAAAVDWDQDGDLDLWITNRTAPAVRYLSNQQQTGHHFLAIKLQGTTSNRDAIGARIEVQLTPAGSTRLVKTVYAGSGYLAQSSKWVHFGLGTAESIDRLTVTWPDGQVEEFDEIDVDRRYRIAQNSDGPIRAEFVTRNVIPMRPTKVEPPDSAETSRIVLYRPEELQTLSGTTPENGKLTLADLAKEPLLLNVWATWCAPCLQELSEWSQRKADFDEAGLRVLAINLDSLGGEDDVSPSEAGDILQKFNFAFQSASADADFIQEIERIRQMVLDQRGEIPIPSSLLIDRERRVAVLYQGPVNVDRAIADLQLLDADPATLRNAAVPFPGRWTRTVAEVDLNPPITYDGVFNSLVSHPLRMTAAAAAILLLIGAAVRHRRRKRSAPAT